MESRLLFYQIQLLKHQISELPIGYISRKNIRGKVRFYHQWMENGKLVSKYLKDGEMEPLQERIEKRRKLQEALSKLEKAFAKTELAGQMRIEAKFNSHIVSGNALLGMIRGVQKWEKRQGFSELEEYLKSEESKHICVLYGLRGAGKTTMIHQVIADMNSECFCKTIYIKALETDTMDGICDDLKVLYDHGYRYVFIDEIVLVKDFASKASLLLDIYAAMGMKIVLAGTDALGVWLASNEELCGKTRMIHISCDLEELQEEDRLAETVKCMVDDMVCLKTLESKAGGRDGHLGNDVLYSRIESFWKSLSD